MGTKSRLVEGLNVGKRRGNDDDHQDDGLRYVFVELPEIHCPCCDSMDLDTLRSIGQEDGTRAKRTRCLNCLHTFTVVIEKVRCQNLANR